MASVRLPVPSLRLLRFLRSQTENLSFFDPSHGEAPALRSILGTARTGPRAPSRIERALPTKEYTNLSASASGLELGRLVQGRLSRTSSGPRLRRDAVASTIGTRCNSTKGPSEEERQSWRDRIGSIGKKKQPGSLKPEDLPDNQDREGDASSMFQHPRPLSRQAALQPRLRCTEIDENGQHILMDGEFKKSELIARFGLQPRDLRKIDSSNLPHILVRPSAIIINLLHLRVLINFNRVLFFDVFGSNSSAQSWFMYELKYRLQQKNSPGNGGLPYEFRAIETVLQSVTQELDTEWHAVREPVTLLLKELEDDIDRYQLRFLLILSKKLSTFEQKATLVRDALDELLEADDDLAAMYLTEKAQGKIRQQDDHTEIEMLLESYHKVCDEIVQETGNLVSNLRNTEEITRAILDANRNELMLLDLKFSIYTLGLAMGTFIAGLYGMNLENFIEETNYGFAFVCITSTILSALAARWGLKKLSTVKRMKMQTGERHGYAWFHNDGKHAGMLDPRGRERLRRNQPKLPAQQKSPAQKSPAQTKSPTQAKPPAQKQ